MRRVFSFDIFDTVITRSVLNPNDVFQIVAASLKNKYPYGSWSVVDYVCARHRAMRLARKVYAGVKEQCNLREIMESFIELERWKIPIQEAITTELQIEQSLCIPMSPTIAKIKALAAANERVIYISDMYLPTQNIWGLLVSAGVPCAIEDVYVSGDIGVGKRTGQLYRHVISRECISPQYMTHTGDNYLTDVKVPKGLGIQVQAMKPVILNRYEKPISRKRRPHITASVNAGVSRAARCAIESSHGHVDSAFHRLAANVAGPLLYAYVEWVISNAVERGTKRLYFLARDSQLCFKIAQKICNQRGLSLECRYLFGSRRAWRLPSIKEVSAQELRWAFGLNKETCHQIIKRLEIDTHETRAVLSTVGFSSSTYNNVLSADALEHLKAQLVTEPLAGFIKCQAEMRRRLALNYFQQEGLVDKDLWAVVDVGWTLSNQRSLRAILESEGYRGVAGYYLGITNEHAPLKEVGDCWAFVTQSGSDICSPLCAPWFFSQNSHAVIEHLITRASHPTTTHYDAQGDGSVTPVFEINENEELAWGFVSAFQHAVLQYVDIVLKNSTVEPVSNRFQEEALSSFRDYTLRPHAADIVGLVTLPTVDGPPFDTAQTKVLAERFRPVDVLKLISTHLTAKYMLPHIEGPAWRAGSAALSGIISRGLYAALMDSRPIVFKNNPSL